MDTLVIGANFLSHDSGIFCIDIEGRRLFGMATERITRCKHDSLPLVPVIRELLREWQVDSKAVRRVVVASSMLSHMDASVKRNQCEEMLWFRASLGARY